MKILSLVLVGGMLSSLATAAPSSAVTYSGVITDSMCTTDHRLMKVSPDEKCVRDCVGDAATFKYALVSARGTYLLSDQETPAQFAGKRVTVTGTLYTKTNILKVDAIRPAK